MSYTEEHVTRAVEQGKREIRQDAAADVVPATAASFSELHDHVDANEYAGLTDEGCGQGLDLVGQKFYDFADAVQGRLDRWIRDGGLRGV